MKHLATLSAILTLAAGTALTAHAQGRGMDTRDLLIVTDMQGMDGGKSQGTVHKGTGVVRKVDAAKGAVTLEHESIKSVNWSAMTMSFNVTDRTLIENLKPGQKVAFEFVQQGKDNVITSIK